MDSLRTDQYTHVDPNCPMAIDMHPADDVVEVALGEHRIGGATLRLVIDRPDTCLRLAETLRDAHNRLCAHLRAKAHLDPALSQLDSVGFSPTVR
jgi:hypothetical protein